MKIYKNLKLICFADPQDDVGTSKWLIRMISSSPEDWPENFTVCVSVQDESVYVIVNEEAFEKVCDFIRPTYRVDWVETIDKPQTYGSHKVTHHPDGWLIL